MTNTVTIEKSSRIIVATAQNLFFVGTIISETETDTFLTDVMHLANWDQNFSSLLQNPDLENVVLIPIDRVLAVKKSEEVLRFTVDSNWGTKATLINTF